MRKKIYEFIEKPSGDNRVSNIYDAFMMITIVISIIPLAFKTTNLAFEIIDYITAGIFIIDYLLRLITADFKLNKKWISFVIYPFTPLAIIDLLSILPTLTMLNSGLKILKVVRLLRTFRMFRTFKVIRYSKSITIILNVIKKQSRSLISVGAFAIAYIFIIALVVFNAEPDTFDTFFYAVYWATVSLTTVGYGDIYPTSIIGQIVTIFSSLIGIAIVALPSGIITAGFMNELSSFDEKNQIQIDSNFETTNKEDS